MFVVGLLGILGFLVFVGLLVYSFIKRKPKKTPLLGMAICFAVFIIGAVATPDDPNTTISEPSSISSSISPSNSSPAVVFPSNEVEEDQGLVSPTAALPSEPIAENETITTTITKDLVVNFLNVGQADSQFIELPNGQTMLIDAGNPDDGDDIIRFIKGKGYTKVDFLIATHPHADHIGGMAKVIESLDIKSIYMPKVSNNTKTFEDLLLTIQNKGLKVNTAKAGISIIDSSNLQINIIAPNSISYDDLNNYSAVIKLIYGNTSFLFMGDAETRSENEITTDVNADVFKVGHHGSNSSTGQSFLDKVSPKYAVISVGANNDYGHPAQKTLDKLSAADIVIYRTDKDETIIFTSDGESITVNKQPSVDENNTSNTPKPSNSPSAAPSVAPTPSPSVEAVSKVVISSVDKKGEIVKIKNTGNTDVNMTGWVLVSVTGEQRFTFPSYTLKAGGTVSIASGDASGDLKWTSKNIWNNSESDPAELYDAKGMLVDSY